MSDASEGCPYDTDGDGDCGRPACPTCGKFRSGTKGEKFYGEDETNYEEIRADADFSHNEFVPHDSPGQDISPTPVPQRYDITQY